MEPEQARESSERDQLWASLRALLPEVERLAEDRGRSHGERRRCEAQKEERPAVRHEPPADRLRTSQGILSRGRNHGERRQCRSCQGRD